ncbi:related to conserved hypothetical Ustilaginaceae_specific protein [Ustilago trichophora]|uniref:Related to conserved hypothetical Ustilaginaceae_specific protein n=1 Tax=Ustilago trichophora TaxID=86804 RepID=A0A5C3E4J1_9BASI|nr:related to conserved hypothetical Ustilaginaceae_specific protein [Ustilago trichophora]
MRFVAILVSIIAVLAALCAAAPPPLNPLHVFQMVAQDLWSEDVKHQKEAIVTLKYLFRSEDWERAEYWKPMNDFIRTGGLNERPRSRDAVTIEDAVAHFSPGSFYQDHAYLRPSLDILISRHLKKAKKEYGFDDELLTTPPLLTNRQRAAPVSRTFGHLPKPMTMEEAENMVGDGWKNGASTSGDGRRILGRFPL